MAYAPELNACLDLVVLTDELERFPGQTDWLTAIGTPSLTCVGPITVSIDRQWHVLLEGGLDVDFTTFSPVQFDQRPPDLIAMMVWRGSRVILDTLGRLTPAQSLSSVSPEQPPARLKRWAHKGRLLH